MAKKKSKTASDKINKIFRGAKLKGGTTSYQPELYIGLKYIKEMLKFFQDKQNPQKQPEIHKYIKENYMRLDEKMDLKYFIQMRILEQTNDATKIEDREYRLGDYGKFLLDKYFIQRTEILLLSALILFSIIPYCIFDLQNLINKKLNDANYKKTIVFKGLNPAKRTALQTLLGVHGQKSSLTYKTIPLFFLDERIKGNKTEKTVKEKKPRLKKTASIICLDYMIKDVLKEITEMKKEEYITLEDLYFYLVRCKELDDNYGFETFTDEKYVYSNVFHFLQHTDNINDEEFYPFLEIFDAVYEKRSDCIKVDNILDDILATRIRINMNEFKRTIKLF